MHFSTNILSKKENNPRSISAKENICPDENYQRNETNHT